MTGQSLVGETFELDFDVLISRISYLSTRRARVYLNLGHVLIDEVVDIDIVEVRPSLFIVSWVEANGTHIVHVQDHEHGVVFNPTRLPDGQKLPLRGVIRKVS
jgi:hypothetical protein